MKKQLLLGGIGTLLLGISLVGNLYIFTQISDLKKAYPDTYKEVIKKLDSIKQAKREALPADNMDQDKAPPIFFQSVEFDNESIDLYFDSAYIKSFDEIEIVPKVNFSSTSYGRIITLRGDFKPTEKYSITVKKGMQDEDGRELEDDAIVQVTIPDFRPNVGFITRGIYLPLSKEKMTLPFFTMNNKDVQVTVYKAFENNLNPYYGKTWLADDHMTKIAEKKITLQTCKNQKVYHKLDLGDILDSTPGVYRIVLRGDEEGYSERYVSVTDLALQVIEDSEANKQVVFVRSLSKNKEVANVDITVMSKNNQVVATGKTDETGYALLQYDPAWNKESDCAVAVFARKDGDISYFRFCEDEYRNRHIAKRSMPKAFVFTERGVARPAETFTVSGFIKQEKDNGVYPIKDTPIEFYLLDPMGNLMKKQTLKSDQYGFVQADFMVPETSALGSYMVNCHVAGSKKSCGSCSIHIASYVPDRIKVTGKVLTPTSKINDAIKYEFDANYYFGSKVISGKYSYFVYSELASHPNFWDKSWNVGDTTNFESAKMYLEKGDKTEKSVIFDYPGFSQQGGKSFNPVKIIAGFEASEPGGRVVTGSVNSNLYPTDFFIGVREGTDTALSKEIEFTLLPAQKDAEIEVPKDFKITFEVIKNEWEYVLTKDRHGEYSRQWVQRHFPLEDKKVVKSIATEKYTKNLIDKLQLNLPSGHYTLVAKAQDAYQTRMDFYYFAGEGGSRSNSPNSLYFKTNSDVYEPGDELKFSFDSMGEGEAYLVFGEKEIRGHRIVPVKAGLNEVTMAIPKDIQSGSFFVGCTIVVKEKGHYLRNFGILEARIDQSKAHKLNIEISHAEVAEPETTLPITISLKNSEGKPQGGIVCLYAVDSGVVSLTNYKVPNIYNFFYGAFACPMNFYDTYGLLYEDLEITPDGKIGGDGLGMKLGKIKQKQTARVIAPKIVVPETGKTDVTIKLPDHTGSLSFFAVATNDDYSGSSQSELIIREAATVTMSAPRYIAPGDIAELSFTIINHEVDASDYSLTVDLPPNLEFVETSPKQFNGNDLAKGKQKNLTISVRAKEVFTSDLLKTTLTIGNVVAKDSHYITTRSINVAQTNHRLTILKPNETFTANFDNLYIGEPKGKIKLSGSPALTITNALDWLNNYPHGCLEQTTSQAFPFLSMPVLVKIGLVDPKMAQTLRSRISQAYAEILSMSLSDGSFAMWPGGDYAWQDATIFALHFIFEAEKQQQITIDTKKRKKHLAWLRNIASDAAPKNRMIRAYATYVLAIAGDHSAASMANHIMGGKQKPDFALLFAGGAMIKSGYAQKGIEAVKKALEAKCYNTPGVPTDYATQESRLGLALYILMDCSIPEEKLCTKLALELAKCIRSDGTAWGTTQANAWATLGLAAYATKHPPVETKTEIIQKGKTEIAQITNVKIMEATEGTTIKNGSQGDLIVESVISGIPKQTPPNGGKLILTKDFLNEKGEIVTSVKHGDKVTVRLRFTSPTDIDNVVITDLLPAGLEIEDENLATRSSMTFLKTKSHTENFYLKRLEKRDDRYLIFGNTASGKTEFTYQTRAVIRGKFIIPPVQAEAMYQPDMTGNYGQMGTLTIE